ncbi:hypothetical protein [Pseudobutyrivibrio xylanivorans]|uniref:hypothetical protein n=1 Tax=Pseudobutyrivibrio xylanivorans TaxID=185007 RepID=UPI0011603F3E|nr:hypothetical protein [Pseudobutyrivibrio xylanivorans]
MNRWLERMDIILLLYSGYLIRIIVNAPYGAFTFNYYFLFEATAITSKYLFAAGLMVYRLIFSAVGAEE